MIPVETTAGLYVHVPFCLTRCGYCDFNAHAGLDHLQDAYVRALKAEADRAAREWSGIRFVSVFLGGGTPTTLDPEAILTLLDHLRARFEVAENAEVTCEANPDTVDERSLRSLRAGGITRLSLGVQSFDPSVLASLERVHRPQSAVRALTDARAAGFCDVNLDLIYGARAETLASWRRTLNRAIRLGPEHLSCYALSIEPGTPLGAKVAAGLIPPPDPDLQADMYEVACGGLRTAGYKHYEVSNWSRRGHESIHNVGYWEGRPYLGVGAGAHSFRGRRRWWNVRPPGRYVELALEGRSTQAGGEILEDEARRLERLLLGMRRATGVPGGWVDRPAAQGFVRRGLARWKGSRFALTEPGMLLANEVVLAVAG